MSFIVGQKVISASGGTISTTTGYIVHTFTSSGTFTPSQNGTVEVLVVGAGGSSSPDVNSYSGGGGGGSVIYRKFIPVGAGVSYAVDIGQVIAPISTASTFTHPQGPITAPGGGSGGFFPGGPGVSNPVGSGGGGGTMIKGGNGANIIGLGFSGGSGAPSGVNGGGGGGSGGFGFNATPSIGGNGGIGVSYSITGSSLYYGSGGGGNGGVPNNNISLPQISIYGRGKLGNPAPAPLSPYIINGPGVVIIRYIN